MLKSATYFLLLITAGVLLAWVALSVPHIFLQEQRDDLRDDLLRVQLLLDRQQQLSAYQQLAAAQGVGLDKRARLGFVGEDGAAAPNPSALSTFAQEALKLHRQDLLLFVDGAGKVLAAQGNNAPKEGRELAGLPPVRDALKGLGRDWLGYLDPKGQALMFSGYPVVVDGKVVGAVLLGQRLDHQAAANLAAQVEPAQRGGHRVHVAFFQQGRVFASSARNDAFDNQLSNRAAEYRDSALLPKADADAGVSALPVQTAEFEGRQVAFLVSAARPGAEGSQIGAIVALDRELPGTNLLDLAARATTLEIAPDKAPPTLILLAVGAVLFLVGFLLLGTEYAAPGRKLLAQLRALEANVESSELPLRQFSGVYRQVALHINSALIGLRKRLERERHQHEPLLPDDAVEVIAAPPSQQLMPAVSLERALSVERARATSGSLTQVPAQTPSQQHMQAVHMQPSGLPFAESPTPPAPAHLTTGEERRRRFQTSELVEQGGARRVQLDREESAAPRSPLLQDLLAQSSDDPPSAPVDLAQAPNAPSVPSFGPHSSEERAREELFGLLGGAPSLPAAASKKLDAQEDSTLDIEPGSLLGLLKNTQRPSAQERDLFEPLDEPGSRPGDQRSTAVDNVGIVQSLARQAAEQDEDALARSALAPFSGSALRSPAQSAANLRAMSASHRPTVPAMGGMSAAAAGITPPSETNSGLHEVITAEVGKQDAAFVASLEASEMPTDEFSRNQERLKAVLSRPMSQQQTPSAFPAAGTSKPNTSHLFSSGDSTPNLTVPAPKESIGGPSMSPKDLMAKLKERGAQPFKRGTSSNEPSGLIRPHEVLAEKTAEAENPFVHQAPTTPGSGLTREQIRALIPEGENPDEYKQLFQDFLDTKKQCGEDLEGLTIEKFIQKLDKNRAALMERYHCRTVRFQVYVKEGKAALKATPVK